MSIDEIPIVERKPSGDGFADPEGPPRLDLAVAGEYLAPKTVLSRYFERIL